MVAIKDRLRELGLFAGLIAVTLTSLVWAFSTIFSTSSCALVLVIAG